MKITTILSIVIVLISGCSTNRTKASTSQNPSKTFNPRNLPQLVPYEKPPAPIKQVPPLYPIHIQKQKIQGQVWLEVELLVDGSVGQIEVKQSLQSGPGGLDESAVNAVKQWRFKPAESDGKPVPCWVTFPVTFSLD